MIYFTEDTILTMHKKIILLTGGFLGVKSLELLDYCVKSPFATFDQKDLYPTIIDKFLTLCFNLITKHPFIDGNKRIGIHVLQLGLKINNIEVTFTIQDIITLGLGIADNKINKHDLISLITKRLKT